MHYAIVICICADNCFLVELVFTLHLSDSLMKLNLQLHLAVSELVLQFQCKHKSDSDVGLIVPHDFSYYEQVGTKK